MDIKAFKNDLNQFTFEIENGDFVEEDGFDTAIYLSLLTDARAPENRAPIPEKRRGWLGNLVSPVEGRDLGSLLWLTDQSRLIPNTLNESINWFQLALNHFVEDGLAKSVVVTGDIIPKLGIELKAVITSASGKTSTHYVKLWELTGNAS
jgi:phage gp46-like protein